jgi:hypothetical protein
LLKNVIPKLAAKQSITSHKEVLVPRTEQPVA